MKKIIIACVAILAVFAMISCKSAPTKDKTVNDAFERVFNQYRSGLVLTDAKQYTVQPGDRLSSIANKEFGAGNGYYFPVIMLASSGEEVINDPDVIEPGMHLTIPVLQANLDDANARANIKAYLKDISDVYARKYTETGRADYDTTKTELVKLSDSL
jgi:hypothetical protein